MTGIASPTTAEPPVLDDASGDAEPGVADDRSAHGEDNPGLGDENGNAGRITIADVNQSNGVIHVVDKVLLPK